MNRKVSGYTMSEDEASEQSVEQEEPVYTVEQIIKALQITNADRLAFLSVFERFAVGIDGSLTKLRADIAELNAGINARNEGQEAVILPDEPESEDESEDE